MPTYSYICRKCNRDEELVRSISDYIHNPSPMFCCGKQMERWFPPAAYSKAQANPLAGDRTTMACEPPMAPTSRPGPSIAST